MALFRSAPHSYRPEPHDIIMAILFLMLAAFSAIWPNTGLFGLGTFQVARGCLTAPLYLLLSLTCLTLGRLDLRGASPAFRFVRTFYPQALFGFVFRETILLSAPANGGSSHDAVFAKVDHLIFGFQPAREFSAAFRGSAFVNELMFAAYFSFFIILAVTPWIAWFKGMKEECRREMALLAVSSLAFSVIWIFFRVMGPKYWLPDLHASWYSEFHGGPFTAFFKAIFAYTNLSGSAFPSGHVAISVLLCTFVARSEPRLLPLWMALTCLICLSTVYIYAHWAADVLGGIIATAIVLPLFAAAKRPLYRACSRLGAAGSAFGAMRRLEATTGGK